MLDPIYVQIRKNETNVVRIFTMDMPAQQARFQSDPIAMQQILGVDEIDPNYIEVFPVSDLDELGLAGYLIEGCGVDADLVAPERDRLNAVTGYVMLVHSRAFCGQELTLSPKLPLLASFNEPVTDWSGTDIETESAKPYTSTQPPPRQARSNARRSGAILFAVFILFIAAILVMVMR